MAVKTDTLDIKKRLNKGPIKSFSSKPILLKEPVLIINNKSINDGRSIITETIYRNYSSIITKLKLNDLNQGKNITNFINILILTEIIGNTTKKINYKTVLKYIKIDLGDFKTKGLGISEIEYIALKHDIILSNVECDFILNNIKKMNLKLVVEIHFNSINKIFGQVFEKIVTKKEVGAYYTGENTTNYIIENSIISSLISNWSKIDDKLSKYLYEFENINKISLLEKTIKSNLSFKEILWKLINRFDKIKLLNVIKKIKIIDISCGSGSFIFGAYYLLTEIKTLINSENETTLDDDIFSNNLFGIDIDEEAINILKFRIILESIITENTFSNYSKITENFIVGNSLIKSESKKEFKIKSQTSVLSTKVKKSVFETNLNLLKIISSGGFDVVIGNPPYLEYKKVVESYEVVDYKSIKCNNLYAFILEKNFNILKEGGYMGMIIPISFISTRRMYSIRNLLIENSKFIFCSNFGDRPSCLFNGVHQKLNIIILEKQINTPKKNLYTSSYLHWYSENKDSIFNSLNYIKNDFQVKDFEFKIGSDIEKSIIEKLCYSNKNALLNNTVKENIYKVWLNMRMTFWNKSFLSFQKSNEYKVFSFQTEKDAIMFSALLNSNIFFFYWEVISDVWHITLKELNYLKINFSDFSSKQKLELSKLYLQFEKNLEKNKKRIDSKQAEFEYQHKKDKVLIDKIDLFFKKYFSFTDIEMEYIRNYQLKFRLNEELNEYLKKYK